MFEEVEKLTRRTFNEKIDVICLKNLITCYEDFNKLVPEHRQKDEYDPVIMMKAIYKLCKNDGFNKVTYNFGKNNIKNHFGRLISKNPSLQGIKREIRHMLCHLYYDDIDIVNAHPSFLLQYCEKNKIKCQHLKHYVENRDETISKWCEFNAYWNKDLCKTFVNSIMNGGKVDNIEEDTLYIPEIQRLYYEFQSILNSVADINNDIRGIIKRRKTFNTSGSIISTILCNIECKCLFYIVEYLEAHGFNVDSLQFDGCLVRKSNISMTTDVLKKTSEYVLEKTGYIIELKIKPMVPLIDYSELKPNKDQVKFYYDDKKDFEKKHFKVLYPPRYITLRDDEYIQQSEKQFRETYKHLKTNVEVESKGEVRIERVSFVDVWLNDENIKLYSTVDYKPYPRHCPSDCFNLWRGFDIEKVELPDDFDVTNNEYIIRYNEFLFNLFNKENNIVTFFNGMIAHKIQFPGKKYNILTILFGEEGVGKNRLLDTIRYMFGPKLYIELNDISQLFEKHSTIEEGRLLLTVNEVDTQGTTKNIEALKQKVTSEKLVLNPKGVGVYEVDNNCDVCLTTNNWNALPIKSDRDRRPFPVSCSSYYKGNSDFFTKYTKEIIENPTALRCLFEYFKTFDLSVIPNCDFQNHPFRTQSSYFKELVEYNREKEVLFFEEFVASHQNITKRISYSDVWNAFSKWCGKNNFKIDNMTSRKFIHLIEKNCFTNIQTSAGYEAAIEKVKSNGVRCYGFNFQLLKKYYNIIDEYIDDESDVESDTNEQPSR
jgi:hypothetical protein